MTFLPSPKNRGGSVIRRVRPLLAGVLTPLALFAFGVSDLQANAVTDPTATLIGNTVTSSGQTTYSYTISNTGNAAANLTSFVIPLFSQSDVSSITQPTGWSHAFTTDAATLAQFQASGKPNAGSYTVLLEWSATTPLPEGPIGGPAPSVSGFGFVSPYLPSAGPFKANFSPAASFYGDPPIPNPNVNQNPGAAAVPEPASIAVFFGLALGAGAVVRRRRLAVAA